MDAIQNSVCGVVALRELQEFPHVEERHAGGLRAKAGPATWFGGWKKSLVWLYVYPTIAGGNWSYPINLRAAQAFR
jgi:hypothetical protein